MDTFLHETTNDWNGRWDIMNWIGCEKINVNKIVKDNVFEIIKCAQYTYYERDILCIGVKVLGLNI